MKEESFRHEKTLTPVYIIAYISFLKNEIKDHMLSFGSAGENV
jgi:hypothetical protein